MAEEDPFAHIPRAEEDPFAHISAAPPPAAPAAPPPAAPADLAFVTDMEGFPTDPRFAGTVAKNIIPGVLGAPGAVEKLGAYDLPRILGLQKEGPTPTLFPTPEQVAKGLGVKPAAPGFEGAEAVGQGLGGLISPGAIFKGLKGGAQALSAGWDTVGSALRAVRGAGKTAAESAIAASVKDGSIVEKIISGQEKTTRAELEALRATHAASDENIDRAIRALEAANEPEVARLRGAQESAAAAHDQIRNAIDAIPSADVTGTALKNEIDASLKKAAAARRTVANEKYGAWNRAASDRVAAGDFWQQSPSGKAFLDDLRGRLETKDVTKITSEERNLLENRLLPDLEGVRTPGKPGGLEEAEGGLQITEPTAGKVAPSLPKVLQDTLRKLRDAAGGKPAEGYDAIGQQRAGELANSLAESLRGWEPSLSEADEAYREASEALQPFKTPFGKRATTAHTFDYEKLSADPAKLAQEAFSTPEAVRSLVEATGGNRALVEQAAEQHALRELKGKTPEAMREWLNSKNAEWMAETPAARKAVTETVDRLNLTADNLKIHTASLDKHTKDYAKAVTDEEKSRIPTERRAVAEQAVRDTFAADRAALDNLRANYGRPGFEPDKIVEQLRGIVAKRVADLKKTSPEAVEDLDRQLRNLDAVAGREARTRRLLKWLGAGAAVEGSNVLYRQIFGGH